MQEIFSLDNNTSTLLISLFESNADTLEVLKVQCFSSCFTVNGSAAQSFFWRST